MNFPTNADATDLIGAAQRAAAASLHGEYPTAETLDKLAARVRAAILEQAALGAWRAIGIVDPDDLAPLRVTARLGKPLLGEPAVVVEYDFKQTALASLLVENAAPERAAAPAAPAAPAIGGPS